MALLPVYRWLGLEDDLTRREQWTINALGLAIAVLGAHTLGWIDLTAFSTDVLTGLPGGQQAVVAGMAVLAGFAVVHTVAERDLTNTRWVVAATVGGFFLVDLTYVHTHVFENLPALFYWAVKPFWVGIPMFAAAWWLVNETDVSRRLAYTLAGVFGVVSLQLYYTVVPIPVVDGDPIQIGLIGNLTTGLQVHGLALLGVLAVLVVVMQGRRYVGGDG